MKICDVKIGNRLLMLALCLMLTSVMAACGGDKASQGDFLTVTDSLGRQVHLARKPERIAVTSASFLEPLHEVGIDVVGRPDSRTKMPDYAKDKMSIGQVYQIDMERLIATRPDLVIVNQGMNEKLLDPLKEAGIPALVLRTKSYEDVIEDVRIFAQLAGDSERGEAICRDMAEKIATVQAKMPAEHKRVAIIHSTAQGLTVELPTSIAGSVAKMLGFVNVAEGEAPLMNNADATPYSLETLAMADPEIIFVTSMGDINEIKAYMEEMMASNPAWSTLTAVKTGRIYYLPQDLSLLSPGLHYPEAVAMMAELVYPGELER